MRPTPLALVLLAVVSSLVTVGAVELLRGTRGGARPDPEDAAPAEVTERGTASGSASLVDARGVGARPAEISAGVEARLAELERRLDALERERASARVPVGGAELPSEDELRELVLGWVAADRAAGAEEDEREHEERHRAELEFSARYQALEMAHEHGLERWQQDELAALFLETALRADEIERGIDLATTSPEEMEALWAEFDAWVDERERALTARLDPELYEELYGEE